MVRAVPRDVFVDVCTQQDYLNPSGARPCANWRPLTRNVKHLMAFARYAKVPLLSCVEGRHANDIGAQAHGDCILGTLGQRKLGASLMPRRVLIDTDNSPSVALDILKRHQQAVLLKTHRDPFANPKYDRLLTELPSERFVLFGVSLEVTLRLLALGLMLRHRELTLVTDACGYWDAEEAEMTLRQLRAKDCNLVTTQEYIQTRLVAWTKRVVRVRASRFVA